MTDDAMVMIVDSTNFPVRMATKDVNAIFSKVDDEHFNCAIYTALSGRWTELENLSYESLLIEKIPSTTRALAVGGYSEFGLDDALKAMSIADNLKKGCSSALKNDQIGVLESNLGVFGDLYENDELGLGIGLVTANGLPGALLAIGGYLSGKFDDFVVRELGKVRLAIEDLKRHDGTTCEIFFSISGLNENGQKNSEVGMMVYNVDAMFYLDFLKSANYEDSKVVKLPTGRYTVEIYVKSTKYKFIEYRVMYTFSMFELGIDHYTVASDSKYSDGKVKFDVEVFLSGDSEELNRWISNGVEFGYYVRHADIFDYKRVTSLSAIFASTPFTYNLDVERESFFEENIDYTSFEARAVDYHIGAYAVVDGNMLQYDEQEMELVYDEHPEVHTGESSSVSDTEATVSCEYDNCMFWNALRGVEYFTDSKSESILLDATEEDGECDFHLEGLIPNTTYKYRAYYEVSGRKSYGETKSFKTKGGESCPDANHVHAVDLGLSVKWACCNVGASVPEGYGGYYAWGETEEKSNYTEETYQYARDLDGDGNYWDDSNNWINIGSNISGTQYDVAHVKWGGKWRMPTKEEIKELNEDCTWTWTTQSGVNGMKVTGPNGNSIFLPAAGCRFGTDLYYRGSNGYYWSATLYEGGSDYAYGLYFRVGDDNWGDWDGRSGGVAVRPVTE